MKTPEQVYRRIYFEALDLIVASIKNVLISLLSKHIPIWSSQDVSSRMDYMKQNYAEHVRTGYLFFQLEFLKVLIKDAQINCFADVLKAVKSLTN